jgi:uncharacterized protein (TIGR01244 family)
MARSRTLGTALRYLLSVTERKLGLRLHGGAVEQISNFHRIDARVATGGQPDARQIAALARSGTSTVINLAPHDSANALPGEPEIVAREGMAYVHIPVDFKNPTENDFARFCEAMREAADAPLFVHCAANMRVSAFVYRYRRQVLGEDEAKARADLNHLWEPSGVWADFIAKEQPA